MRAPSVHLIVQPTSRADALLEWLGLGYLLLSLFLSVCCLLLFRPYTSNSFFWPDFESTSNVSHALGWRYNMDLGVASSLLPAPFPLHSTALRRAYSGDAMNAIYPRLVLHTDLSAIETGIAGLRRLSTGLIMYLPTSYCFVDLARRWSLAHTAARDMRCHSLYAANGAVVFETTMRNVNLPSWLQQHSALAMDRIGVGVASLPGGTEWLYTMGNHSMVSIPIEAAIWRAAGLTYYDVSYSNRVVHGLDEAISIQNALGYHTRYTIKALTQAIPRGAWTTSYLQSVLGFDLAALQANQSLVRASVMFFGHAMPNQIEAYVLGYPLNALQTAVHTSLGQLASIDQRWVPPPMRLVDAVQRLAGSIALALSQDTALLATYEAIPRLLLTPIPLAWARSDLLFYSGSPLCLYGSPAPFALESFRFDDACGVQRPLQIQLAPLSSLFAMAVLTETTVLEACLLCPPPQRADCRRHVQAVRLVYTRLQALATIHVDSSVLSDVNNVSILQIVANASTPNDIQLATVSVLDRPWTFFGIGSVVDWALISREVVLFEGDVAALCLLSAMSMPVSHAPPKLDQMGSSAIYLWYASTLVSLGLVLVAGLLVCIKVQRPLLASRWWLFSPIVGPIWIGRCLLLVRGGTALICLATAPLSANVQTTLLQLVPAPRSLLTSSILSGETLWLTYLLHELLQPVWPRLPSHAVHISASLAWLSVLVLDHYWPPSVVATISRSCYAVDMDAMLYCASGTLASGHPIRILVLLAMHAGIVLCVIGGCHIFCQRPDVAPPSLHFSAAAVHCLPACTLCSGAPLSAVTAGMCGLFQYTWHKHHFTFNSKLWHHLPSRRSAVTFAVPDDISSQVLSMGVLPPPPRTTVARHWLSVFAGLTYLVLTLLGNVTYLSIVQESLANDFMWAGFNRSGVYPFLANQLNRILDTTNDSLVALADGTHVDTTQAYDAPDASIWFPPTSARRQLYAPSQDFAHVVGSLRAMDPCRLPWMSTQYCWLDVRHLWSMASTVNRQARCETTAMQTNGAVYLETGLRNLNDWEAWMSCWGTSFEIGFQRYLETSLEGREWLTMTPSAMVRTSIPDEVDYWRNHGLSTYQLQWQNYKTIGWSDGFTITNALGMTYALQLGYIASATHREQETSFRMYWSFASDLWAIATTNTTSISGSSLIRTSPQFAFTNRSSMVVLTENRTLPNPLSSGLERVASVLGPFNSIDMFVVPCPRSAQFFVTSAATALAHVLHVDAAGFSKLPVRDVLQQIPPALLADANAYVTGGNIFCGNDVAPYPSYGGLYGSFGANKLCHNLQLDLLYPTARHVAASILGMHAIYGDVVDFQRICALDTLASPSCATDYGAFWTYLTQTHAGLVNATTTAAATAFSDVQALNVSVIQFVTSASTTHQLYLVTTSLFPLNEIAWSFYGWHFLYEWAIGRREVVRFHGDTGDMTILSSADPLLSMPPSPIAVPWTFTWLLQLSCQYITFVLIGVVGLGACHTLVVSRGQLEGFNLLCVNRLVGLVWVGRPLLLLRSITALALLNTAPLTLVRSVGDVTYAISPPLPWYKTILAAAEVTWLVYVLNDVLSCITLQYTSTYAFKSANVAWTIGAISTFLLPVYPVCHYARRCNVVNMDDSVDCVSANVAIGSINRVYILISLSTLSIFGCFALDRWRWPHLPTRDLVSASLNAHSIYMLRFDDWKVGNEYFLDTTSAIMTGLLAWRHKAHWYVFDIKTWRLVRRPFVEFTTTHNGGAGHRFQRAIPISRL